MSTYDQQCEDATAAAEKRLIDHFEHFGGDVWMIGSGCQHCQVNNDDLKNLKKCSVCQAALFCNRDCLAKAWSSHKRECFIISTFNSQSNESNTEIVELLEIMSFQTLEKNGPFDPKVVEVIHSLGIETTIRLPGWFFTIDFKQASPRMQKILYQTAVKLYGLLRDEALWTQDKDSFPRSSYTYVSNIAHVLDSQTKDLELFLAKNGHLLLFTAWLQHPEPPATQSLPLEMRSFHGVIDAILQIELVRNAIDRFMAKR